MCKKGNPHKIDKCMNQLIRSLKVLGVTTLASCCGHGKYPMSVVVAFNLQSFLDGFHPWELFTGKTIARKSRFYVKDKRGIYFIPETLKGLEGK